MLTCQRPLVGNSEHEKQFPSRHPREVANPIRRAARIAAANQHTVVVLKTGGLVLMPWLNKVPAVVEAWYPGEEDGNAVADLLFGKTNPSGKLPMTFPRVEGDVPAATPQQYPGVNGTVVYSEKLKIGYRWYDSENITPLFPFGYGLSYTRFQFARLRVPDLAKPGDRIRLWFDITDTGSRAGAEVPQAYVADPPSAGEPPKELVGFAKVMLQPHETKHLTIVLDPRAFSIWDGNANRWTVMPGPYEIFVGNSVRDLPLHATIKIER
jgi:beta-glucosidase